MKFIQYLLLLLLIASYADAATTVNGALTVNGAITCNPDVASCTTLKDSETGASGGTYQVGKTAGDTYTATKFTAGSSYTACGVDVYLQEIGDMSGLGTTIQACIFSHDGVEDDPDSQVGTCSDTRNMSEINDGGVETAYTFSNMSASLTNTTTYWVVLVVSGVDASNYAGWHYAAGSVTRITKDGDGAGTWSLVAAAKTHKYKLYSN